MSHRWVKLKWAWRPRFRWDALESLWLHTGFERTLVVSYDAGHSWEEVEEEAMPRADDKQAIIQRFKPLKSGGHP